MDLGTWQTVYLITDPDKMHWIITHIMYDINECITFKISNGYGKRWVFSEEISPVDDSETGKIGFKK